jgi:hypothetical protein
MMPPNQTALYNAIKNQISPVNCVIILAGVYSTYSKWINKEIEISKQVFNKPIVAVESKACRLTVLGEHYRRLVKRGRI